MKHEGTSRQTHIIISGVESDRYWEITVGQCGIRNVLMSYHYLQKKGSKFLKDRLEKTPDVKILIDSGAHTFYAKIDEYSQKPDSFWEDYLEKYTKWLAENKDYVTSCANLDIEGIVGVDKVDEWNKKYFEPLEELGIDVCYIWHAVRGNTGWEEYCKKHKYVGLSTENDSLTTQHLSKMLTVSKRYNTRVHGMALTKTEVLVRVPFYSVDSSVDGKSSILVKDIENDRTFRTTIEDLYNQNLTEEFRTSEHETRVPYDNFKVLTVDNDNKVIWGDLYGVVKHKVKKKTVKLKIEGGRDITCTTDHSIITMDKQGNLIETKADELKAGDFVLTPKQFDINNETVPFTNVLIDKPRTQSGEKEWQVVELSDKFLQFLGLWIGDGHFSNDTTGFSCYQDLECSKVIDYISDLYGAKVSVSSNGIDARISNIRLQRVMKELGFDGTSSTKRIPKFIYSLSREQICQFLKGYFSADGTGSCECSTVSESLKDDLVELLSMLGINVSTSFMKSRPYCINGKTGIAKDIWHLSIRNKQSKIIFKDNIGFLQEFKNKVLDTTIKCIPDREPKCAGVPKTLAITKSVRTDSKHTTSIDKWKGKRISRGYDGVFTDKVKNSELLFMEIKSIELINDGTEEVEVYDLSVRNYERFFANGILVHNTTWLVGQQYGELNWFDGRKMKRLSKSEWQRSYKTKLLKEPFNADWDRLINGMGGRGDTYELLRLNVIAYKLAEEHILKRLNSKMYWIGAKATGGATKSKDDVLKTTPDLEWFSGDCENYQDYLKVLMIDETMYTKEEAVDILYYFYMFLNDDEEALSMIDDADLIDYANQALETPIATREDAIRELKDYFVENALGERDDFKSEAPVQPKERAKYIEDDDFTIIDLSENDLKSSPLLPQFAESSMPEVTEYDEELAKNGIAVVRDDKGRFLKGQQKVRKPKNIYSDKYPKLVCDTCYKSGDCPQYKAGYVCAFDRTFKKFDSRKLDDLLDGMGSIVEFNMGRLQRAMMFEMMDGGMPTAEVNHLIDQNMRYLEKMKDIVSNSPRAIVEQRKVLKSDGTQEITTSVGVTPQTGGILSQIFGDSNSKARDSEDTNN